MNVQDYGVLPTNTPQDNTANLIPVVELIRTAGGGTLYFPFGTYVFSSRTVGKVHPIQFINMGNATVYGDGMGATVLKLDPNGNYNHFGDTHVLYLDRVTNIGVHDLTIDGSYDEFVTPAPNEHMHGLYIGAITGNTSDVLAERIELKKERGDGIYMLAEASNGRSVERVEVNKCVIRDTGRSCIAHQRGLKWIKETNNYFINPQDQSLDFEASGQVGAIEHVIIAHNHFVHDADSLCVALTGNTGDSLARDVQFVHNTIDNGAILAGLLEDSIIAHNIIRGDVNHRAVELFRRNRNVRIEGNVIENNYNINGVGAIHVDASGHDMTDIVVADNIVKSVKDGILIRGDLQGISVHDNKVAGNGERIGISIDLTLPTGEPHYSYQVHDNEIKNFATGLVLGTNSADTTFDSVSIHDNVFVDTQETPTQTTGVFLNVLEGVDQGVKNLMIANNVYGRGIVTKVVDTGNRQKYWQSGTNEYETNQSTPEGLIQAGYGAEAKRINGAPSLFVKEMASGTSGWVTK